MKCRKIEAMSSYIHPQINKKLLRVRDGLPLEDVVGEIFKYLLSGVWYNYYTFRIMFKSGHANT